MDATTVAHEIYQSVRENEEMYRRATGRRDLRSTHVIVLHPELAHLLEFAMQAYLVATPVRPEQFSGYEIKHNPHQPRCRWRLVPRESWEAIEAEHRES